MFTIEFLEKYPKFAACEGVPLTLLPPRYRPRPIDEVIRDDEELDTKIKSEKKKIPESPEAVVFIRAYLPPHVWFQFETEKGHKIQIVDAISNDYVKIIDLLLEHYLPYEPLCKAMRILDDEDSLHEYLHQIVFFLDSSSSLVALDSEKNIVGVLVGRVEDLDECSEKAYQKTVFNSKRLQTIYNLVTFMTKTVNIHEKYLCKSYFRLYVIATHRNWSDVGNWLNSLAVGVEKALITGAMRLANVMKINRIAGAMSLYKDQYYLRQFGAVSELDVYFSEWRTDRGLRIFRGTGKTEPKISFVSMAVPENVFEPSRPGDRLPPLSCERARRFISKRILLWGDLDIYRACNCHKPKEPKVQLKKRRMRFTRPEGAAADSEHTSQSLPISPSIAKN